MQLPSTTTTTPSCCWDSEGIYHTSAARWNGERKDFIDIFVFSGAEFVFSEPHSKRLRLKLRFRREVLNDIVLEQNHPVEFVASTAASVTRAPAAQANPDQWVAPMSSG
ncbi:hypothetical protein QYE76_068034 [Lolium multiflorum]|uniref:Uncharacterized protein n=1 Tax=Lolium multiflorum TaxID=4521 RepID=A0AAD8SEH3_LOLMU|nr:hypothetical protein QYE76_068034 [Lolium multiflorum]